ncbi:MAG: thioredoxin family protein [Crocinitomicaceae bacterium]|nr:thioredoxin family protein [Crocinitomicaceae bacterium]
MSIFKKKTPFLKFLSLFLLLPTISISISSLMTSNDDLKIGSEMPLSNIEMKGVDGKTTDLSSYLDKNGLVVVFSCNTCPFVVGSDNFEGWEKQYNTLFRTAKEKNIGFVLVNSNEAKRDGDDSLKEMIKHAKSEGYLMPYLVDKDSKLANAFGAKTTPHVYVFNENKELTYKGSIDNIWDSKRSETIPYLENAMSALLDKTELKENSTPPRGCSIKRTK